MITSTGGAIYGDADVIPTPGDRRAAADGGLRAVASSAPSATCGWYERLYGLSTMTLRFGNVYGPRQDPHGEAGVIAIFCGRLLDGGRPTIFGDGRQTRDYIFVGDIVAANLAVAAHPEAYGEFNIGTGVETSVIELVDALREAAGEDASEFEPEFAPARAGEVVRSCLDASRARSELGFTASTSLVDGLRATLDAVRAETPAS